MTSLSVRQVIGAAALAGSLCLTTIASAQMPTLGVGGGARAPQPPTTPKFDPALLQNPHVKALDQLLDQWNTGTISFPAKRQLTPQFETMLKLRFEQRPGGYEGPDWQRNARALWADLPETLTPRLPLSTGARLAIYAGFVDNLGAITVAPSAEELFAAVRAPLFELLALSQDQAVRRKDSEITSFHIVRAVSLSLTSVFPLCSIPKANP